ncbi:MAG: TlpA disulfide reductase family protein [Phycisphaerae bacterium]
MLLLKRAAAIAVLIGILAPAGAWALDLGDPAPPLQIGSWIKGRPVDLAEGKGKTVYVVEFWATWCPPCRQAVPHLTQLQKRFKDRGVVVVSISDEPAGRVKPFVDKMGKQMEYVVAVDERQQTSAAYMGGFGVRGIPRVFVIDKQGRVVWHGHPMDRGIEAVLNKVLIGKYDVASGRPNADVTRLLYEYMAAAEDEKYDRAREIGERIFAENEKNPDVLSMLAMGIATAENIKGRDLELALKAGKTAYEADGAEPRNAAAYASALNALNRSDEAIEYMSKALELCKDNRLRSLIEEELDAYLEKAGKPPRKKKAKIAGGVK